MHNKFLFEKGGAGLGYGGGLLGALLVLEIHDAHIVVVFGFSCHEIVARQIKLPLSCLFIKEGIVIQLKAMKTVKRRGVGVYEMFRKIRYLVA